MAVDVTTETLIHRPRVQVATYAADPDNAPKWYVNIEAVRWETEPPLEVGSRIAFIAHFLGRRLEYTYEVLELFPTSRLLMATAEGPFPMETTYSWDDAEGGATRMTLRNRGSPSGFGRLATPLLRASIARANQKDLQRLKMLLEKT
jgi:uncharacterized membrane protein